MARIYTHPQRLRYAEDTTLSQILLHHNLNGTPGSKPAIIDGYSGETVYTYDSFRTSVRKVARHLVHELGIGRGTVVGILSTNRASHLLCFLDPLLTFVESSFLANMKMHG